MKKWMILGILFLSACATAPKPKPQDTGSYADGFIHGNTLAECPDCPEIKCDYSSLARANADLKRRLDECLEAGSNEK